MGPEAALLAAMASSPDDELPRLAYADWLEENGEPRRAELVRLSCRLDPHRDSFDDDAINSLRRRVEELRAPEEDAEQKWRASIHEPMRWGVEVGWRWGFVDSLALPVQWFLRFGREFRERYPLLRKLVLFRLNGWGERLAGCEWLPGLREVEFPCWYADPDAQAVANSPHLGAVERLVLWGGGPQQGRLFARGTAWPRLRELHLVSQAGAQQEWVRAVNEAAGRPLATVYDFGSELFPFAPNFADCYGFFVGKLPDGTQLFAYGDESSPTADGWLFRPDGTRREPFRFEFPPELVVLRAERLAEGWLEREKQMRSARKAYLMQHTGFVPAFIRVEGFSLEACGLSGTARYRGEVEECWGQQDDPDVSPEDDEWPGGYGWVVYQAVRSGEYTFDFGNEWWCDRTGHVHST
jgi:uncharacterized protein (TIGR02996 family)